MSQTVAILDALVGRLKGAFEQKLAIELFPENPKNYRLNHPRGAILVAFGSSRFGDPEALDAVFQERNLMLPLTLVFRQLNGRDGVVTYLDAIRDCLTGWYPRIATTHAARWTRSSPARLLGCGSTPSALPPVQPNCSAWCPAPQGCRAVP